jgi:hypothetical protein
MRFRTANKGTMSASVFLQDPEGFVPFQNVTKIDGLGKGPEAYLAWSAIYHTDDL